MNQIVPIIQTESIEDLQSKLDHFYQIEWKGKPTHFQIDIVDGIFADYFSVQPADLREIDWHGFTHEYHLLVTDPDDYLGDVKSTGATQVIAQVERLRERATFIKVAQELKLNVGLALDLYTPVSDISAAELDQLDIVLLMSVQAGLSGQTFNSLVLQKIQELRTRGFEKAIEVDGGVNASNIVNLLQAGASHLAVNTALWHDGTVEENLSRLVRATEEYYGKNA